MVRKSNEQLKPIKPIKNERYERIGFKKRSLYPRTLPNPVEMNVRRMNLVRETPIEIVVNSDL